MKKTELSNNINSAELWRKIKEQATEISRLKEDKVNLENEIYDLNQKIKKMKGSLTLLVTETWLQEAILKEYAKDKPIGLVFIDMKAKGYDVTLETVKTVLTDIEDLPLDLREYYEKEREYYKQNANITKDADIAMKSLVLNQNILSILLAKAMEDLDYSTLGPEEILEAEERIMKISKDLREIDTAIIKVKREDKSYDIALKREIEERTARRMENYKDNVNKILNIDDILQNNNVNVMDISEEVIEFDE